MTLEQVSLPQRNNFSSGFSMTMPKSQCLDGQHGRRQRLNARALGEAVEIGKVEVLLGPVLVEQLDHRGTEEARELGVAEGGRAAVGHAAQVDPTLANQELALRLSAIDAEKVRFGALGHLSQSAEAQGRQTHLAERHLIAADLTFEPEPVLLVDLSQCELTFLPIQQPGRVAAHGCRGRVDVRSAHLVLSVLRRETVLLGTFGRARAVQPSTLGVKLERAGRCGLALVAPRRLERTIWQRDASGVTLQLQVRRDVELATARPVLRRQPDSESFERTCTICGLGTVAKSSMSRSREAEE